MREKASGRGTAPLQTRWGDLQEGSLVTVRAMAGGRRAVEAPTVREAPWCAYEVRYIGEQQITMCTENGVADDRCAERNGAQPRQHTAAAKRVTHLLKNPHYSAPPVFHWWSARAFVKATWELWGNCLVIIGPWPSGKPVPTIEVPFSHRLTADDRQLTVLWVVKLSLQRAGAVLPM